MEFEIRAATRDEIADMQTTMGIGFGFDPVVEYYPHFLAYVPLDRTRCVFEGDTLVATSGAFSLELAVPGRTVPTGGTTLVAVRSTHRRRGFLTAMMRAHFEDVRERGEPLAGLWASESSIYGRFGYGPAAYGASLEIARPHAVFAEPLEVSGRFRLLDEDEASALLPPIYEQIWRERPGHFARNEVWWEHRHLYDPEWDRGGASRYRFALYEDDGQGRGYVKYRVKRGEERLGIPAQELRVIELQGVDAAARAALWSYVLNVDLVATVSAWNQPVDEDLPWLLADRRRLATSLSDSLWIRPVDVAGALESRAYAQEGRLVLGVRDSFCPWNNAAFELEGGPRGAKCRTTSSEPEIRLGVAELGALYLGGNRFQALARAGRIEGSPEALRRADTLFTWDPAPWCPEIF